MAKFANKGIYIIKERASRECHTEENTDLCSVRENKYILQGRQTLYSYLQALIYSLPVPIYLCLIVLEGTSTIDNKVSPFDQFKTNYFRRVGRELGPEDDQYCFHEINEYLNSLNPQKKNC